MPPTKNYLNLKHQAYSRRGREANYSTQKLTYGNKIDLQLAVSHSSIVETTRRHSRHACETRKKNKHRPERDERKMVEIDPKGFAGHCHWPSR